MKRVNLKLPEIAKENIKDMDNSFLKRVETDSLLNAAQSKADMLRTMGLDEKIKVKKEFYEE